MSAPRYLSIELAEKEAICLPAKPANLNAVHIFDVDSIYAINAALASGRPLLVRGEPGVGKSQLARAAAKKLGRVFIQHTVDIQTESQDLLWYFDTVSRLAEAQIAGAYYSCSANLEQSRKAMQTELDISMFLRPGPLWWAFNWKSAQDQAKNAKKTQASIPTVDEGANSDNGCVLLIDEIDKAETDVPNGLLEAFGAGQFNPPGSNPIVAGEPAPLVVITTNEERALPDAFLRRCMVLNLEFPKSDKLVERGRKHFTKPDKAKSDISDDILELAATQLYRDRKDAEDNGVRPLPGQAEYIDLLRVLHNLCPHNPEQQKTLMQQMSRFALIKHRSSF